MKMAGSWLCAIKSVTIIDGHTMEIVEADLHTTSESESETPINASPYE